MIIGLSISVVLNIILLICFFIVFIKFIVAEAVAEDYRLQWGKWEREYWAVRNLKQNSKVKLSWVADGKIEI